MILRNSHINFLFLIFFFAGTSGCNKKPPNNLSENNEIKSDEIVENKLQDQDRVYGEFLWLSFEKIINNQLLKRMKEEKYKNAEGLLMLNSVFTSNGANLANLRLNNIMSDDFTELRNIIELVQSNGSNLETLSNALGIEPYNESILNSEISDKKLKAPQLADFVFLSLLLKESPDEFWFYNFVNKHYNVDGFLDVYIEGKTLDGDRALEYMLDFQFEIYAKSNLYAFINSDTKSCGNYLQESIWSKMLNNLGYYEYSCSGDSIRNDDDILSRLIRNDKSEKRTLLTNDLEKWYLNDISNQQFSVCETVNKLEELFQNYYLENEDAFEECDCWIDYKKYIILNTINSLAFKYSKSSNGRPIKDTESIDCLESLADEYQNLTGEDFSYNSISPYFMFPYSLLASENGRHQGFFKRYMGDQAKINTYMFWINELYSMRLNYSY